MKKTSLYLDPAVDRALQAKADRDGITKAELIRRTLSNVVDGPRPMPRHGVFVGPPDLAENIDRYLETDGFGTW